jgi:hypothetical protein
MAPRSLLVPIYVVLALYAADGIISLSFLSTMVAWLQRSGGAGPFTVNNGGGTFRMPGEPLNLMTNHGHVTNGAGGTAVVLIGFGGIIALISEHKSRKKYGKSSTLFLAWAVCVVLSWLLTLSALIYTFVLQNQTSSQTISLEAAARAAPAKYPLDSWTPESWYNAMLALPLADDSVRGVIAYNLRIMRGWRYNLIALFLVGFVLMVLVVAEVLRGRKSRGTYGRAPSGEVEK